MRNLLQPIVENSIFHGLKNSEDSLHITISARDNGDVLTIVIADNGIGIPEDKLGTLLSNNISTKKHHIGLNNVNTRIKLYYGYEYGLTISSAENEGTIVIIKLPLTFENAEE